MPIKTENKKNKGGKMKVKITKNNDENYWYNDRVGEVFEVEETTYPLYYRANGRYKGCYIDKDDCVIIEENPLEGADKLSEQIIKNDWAKMPKVKEETGEEEQYVVVKPIMDVPAEEIKVKVNDTSIIFIFPKYSQIKPVIGNPSTIPALISLGIIAEKKSKADKLADGIDERIYRELKYLSRPAIKQIILEELGKVMK